MDLILFKETRFLKQAFQQDHTIFLEPMAYIKLEMYLTDLLILQELRAPAM